MGVHFLSVVALLQALTCSCLPRPGANASNVQDDFSVGHARRLQAVKTWSNGLDAVFYDLDECFYPFGASGMAKWEVKIAEKFLTEKHGFTSEKYEDFLQIFAGEKTIWDALLKAGITSEQVQVFSQMICSETPYEDTIKKDPQLRQALAATPGPRYILSNNWHCHCAKIVDLLGVADLIDEIIGIDDINDITTAKRGELIIKPNPEFYTMAMKKKGCRRGLMVDDRYYNCEGAEKAGMAAIQMAKYIVEKDPSKVNEISSQGADFTLKEDSTIPIVKDWSLFPSVMKKCHFMKSPHEVGTYSDLAPQAPPLQLRPSVATAATVPKLPPPRPLRPLWTQPIHPHLPVRSPAVLKLSTQMVSDIISIPIVSLVFAGSIVLCICSRAALTTLRFRRSSLTVGEEPLLIA